METFSASLALCAGKSPVTGEFPAQRASNTENVPVWWRHHDIPCQANAVFNTLILIPYLTYLVTQNASMRCVNLCPNCVKKGNISIFISYISNTHIRYIFCIIWPFVVIRDNDQNGTINLQGFIGLVANLLCDPQLVLDRQERWPLDILEFPITRTSTGECATQWHNHAGKNFVELHNYVNFTSEFVIVQISI